MIFNREFDKTLRLILEGDKDNRKIILDFIDSIPAPLYQQILDALVKFREVREEDIYILDREDIEGEFVLNNDIRYYFTLDMILNCLTIGKMFLIGGGYRKIFEISMFSDPSYNKVDNFGERYLGSLYEFFDNNKVDYELVNSILGLMVVSRGIHLLPVYKKIDKDKIFDDMTTKDLKTNDKLVKIRKMY